MYAERTIVDKQEALALGQLVAEEQRAYQDEYRRNGAAPSDRGYIAVAPEAGEGTLFAEGIVHIPGQSVRTSEAHTRLLELTMPARREKAMKELARLRPSLQTWRSLGSDMVGMLLLYDDTGVDMLDLRRRALERAAGEAIVSRVAEAAEPEPTVATAKPQRATTYSSLRA